eukprot:gnl/Spiro4/1443_TR772_c0_g1_i1.p2 gnl/Spiro4/1443_TR772_c0_g1~~gnl/Spiro4/1443_TR772_c0_g1_i1.p2  ORF type:complete len:234 (+),score=50.85 gnl/Spiro4/1443_TR772_c0_g1_i1:60-761(+)
MAKLNSSTPTENINLQNIPRGSMDEDLQSLSALKLKSSILRGALLPAKLFVTQKPVEELGLSESFHELQCEMMPDLRAPPPVLKRPTSLADRAFARAMPDAAKKIMRRQFNPLRPRANRPVNLRLEHERVCKNIRSTLGARDMADHPLLPASLSTTPFELDSSLFPAGASTRVGARYGEGRPITFDSDLKPSAPIVAGFSPVSPASTTAAAAAAGGDDMFVNEFPYNPHDWDF